MKNVAEHLHAAVAAVAPIVGVSVGSADDKRTWVVAYAPEATDKERAAGAAVVAAFDVAAVPDEQRIATRDFVARFTDAEWRTLKGIRAANATVDRKMDQLLAGATVNLLDAEFVAFAEQLSPTLWPDAAVRADRVAALTADSTP